MRNLKYRLDLAFSAGKGKQILWLAGLVLLLFAIAFLCNFAFHMGLETLDIFALIFSPGEFRNDGHAIFQVIVNFVGLVLVSTVFISLLSNAIENRAEAFERGLVRYKFTDHLLFLGADEMLVDTIEGQFRTGAKLPSAIVVLTEQQAVKVRERLLTAIQDKQIRKRLVVLYGDRTKREQLLSVYVKEAQRVFILGEPNESDHDTKNTLCLNELRLMAEEGVSRVIDCYMVCDSLSTLRIMQLQTEPLPKGLHLTVTNALESWAQRILVNQDGYPKLYRKETISPDDEEYVHLVLVGATQMAFSLGLTAAHTAHYPNYITKGKRTKITLIDRKVGLYRDFLLSHYESLFRLSRHDDCIPPKDFDFMDLEWQFIEADIDSPNVRESLKTWAQDKGQMLTIAYCFDDIKANLSAALYAPDEVMTAQIPLLVYQPTHDALAAWTQQFTRYKNIYPFGMRQDCYDKTLRQRIQWAMAANEAYEDNAVKLNPKRIRKGWHDLKLAIQFSNMYSANYSYAVLRHVDKKYHAELEHQRWLTERLLLGYKAMDKKERIRIEQLPEAEKWKEMERLDPYFLHPNIQPFNELTPESVHKDEVMTECMMAKFN